MDSDLNVRTRHQGYPTGIVERSGHSTSTRPLTPTETRLHRRPAGTSVLDAPKHLRPALRRRTRPQASRGRSLFHQHEIHEHWAWGNLPKLGNSTCSGVCVCVCTRNRLQRSMFHTFEAYCVSFFLFYGALTTFFISSQCTSVHCVHVVRGRSWNLANMKACTCHSHSFELGTRNRDSPNITPSPTLLRPWRSHCVPVTIGEGALGSLLYRFTSCFLIVVVIAFVSGATPAKSGDGRLWSILNTLNPNVRGDSDRSHVLPGCVDIRGLSICWPNKHAKITYIRLHILYYKFLHCVALQFPACKQNKATQSSPAESNMIEKNRLYGVYNPCVHHEASNRCSGHHHTQRKPAKTCQDQDRHKTPQPGHTLLCFAVRRGPVAPFVRSERRAVSAGRCSLSEVERHRVACDNFAAGEGKTLSTPRSGILQRHETQCV